MSPTWSTESDWDNAQSETGVHHEQPTGTDWAASDVVEKGWPSTDEGDSSLEGYWPCDEESGSTFADVTANGNDLSIGSAVTLGSTGVLGTTAGTYALDAGSYAQTTGVACNTDRYTAVCWFNYTDQDGNGPFITTTGDETSWPNDGFTINFDSSNANLALWHHSGGNNNQVVVASDTTISTNTWYMVVGQTNGAVSDGRLRIYDSTGQIANVTGSGTRNTTTTIPVTLGQGSGNNVAGEIEEARVYSRELSQTECDELHGAML